MKARLGFFIQDLHTGVETPVAHEAMHDCDTDNTGRFVLVEHGESFSYGEGGGEWYRSVGDVIGTFKTAAEAEAHGKELNDARGWYTLVDGGPVRSSRLRGPRNQEADVMTIERRAA